MLVFNFAAWDSPENDEITELVKYLWSIMVFKFAIITFVNNIVTALSADAIPSCGKHVQLTYNITSTSLTNSKCTFVVLNTGNSPQTFPMLDNPEQLPPGAILKLISTIFQLENLSYDIQPPNFNYSLENDQNGSFSRTLLQELQGFNSCIYANNYGLNLDRYSVYDSTFYTFEDGLFWVIPAAKLIPTWLNITLVFKLVVWLGILITFGVIVLTLFTFENMEQWLQCHGVFKRNRVFSTHIMNSLKIHLSKYILLM